MRTYRKAQSIMMVLCMALGLSACSESKSDEPVGPVEPGEPAAGEWQTVPVGGGDVRLGNLTLSLPAGTFGSEQKVAVTKLPAGQVCGQNEASAFYQISMPVTTLKPVTLRLTAADLGEGVCLVTHEDGFAQSGDEAVPINIYAETTYADGAYTATLPEMENGEGAEGETLSFSVGLVRVPRSGKASSRGLFDDVAIAKGEVAGIKYELYADASAKQDEAVWQAIGERVNGVVTACIEQSIQVLHDMGFRLKAPYFQKRVVPFYYTKLADGGTYGLHVASKRSYRYSIIALGVDPIARKLGEAEFDPTDIRTTIIHELFHLFQYDMDPRSQFSKGAGYFMGDMSILFEMAAVWAERYMNNGKLNASFISDHITLFTRLGMGHDEERFADTPTPFAEQGYTLAPWLEYVLDEMNSLGIRHEGAHPVYELFDIFSRKWTYWTGTYTAYHILQEWLDTFKSPEFNYWWAVDTYYQRLWMGQLVPGFDVQKAYITQKEGLTDKFGRLERQGELYPYGCCVNKFVIKGYRGQDLSRKALVVKQASKGMRTNLLYASRQDRFERVNIRMDEYLPAVCYQGDSIVMSGRELESFCLADGSIELNLFLLPTPQATPRLQAAGRTPKLTSQVSIELRDEQPEGSLHVSPTELVFAPEGGTQSITARRQGYRLMGCLWEKDPGWGQTATVAGDDRIEVCLPENTAPEERRARLIVWAAARDYAELDRQKDRFDTVMVTVRQLPAETGPQGRFEIVGGHVGMDIRTEPETSMGELYFTAGDGIVSMTPKGKGVHFELKWNGSDDKYTDVVQCTFDLDDISLLPANKASITGISWKRQTDNWSGPSGHHWWGIWGGTDHLLRQKQDIAFSSSQKLGQSGWNEPWNSEYWSANFWAFDQDIPSPSACYFHRWSLGQYVDGEAEVVDNGDEMLEGSSLTIDLWLKYVEE